MEALQTLLQESDADYGIVGEGEVVFVELLNCLENGEDPSVVKVVISLKAKGIYLQAEGIDMRKNVWSRIGNHFPLKPFLSGEGVYPLQSKRGCALKCVYCTYVNIDINLFLQKVSLMRETPLRYASLRFSH